VRSGEGGGPERRRLPVHLPDEGGGDRNALGAAHLLRLRLRLARGVGFPQREAMESLPTATVVVAMSSTYGLWAPARAATLIGLVPSIGFRAKVGTMASEGALVKANPIIPRASAIIE
jgi:hypothetical protein